ncbi:hypothetical protein [Flavobacterium sp. UMI-01]|uniref:hypothetical protein n=1 Tax=Flavobacterium sp. UMI-01 TaxID=1441053 RepID=UPI001C7D459F|nr:hypothetical protein [Flavobacterium sp. UMI-01]GIZ07880.1 hypothetical protein FUMI01_06070 [Flavobacterium sp. UMI-01]
MKSLIVILLFFSFTLTSFSQEKPASEDGAMDITKLPEIVINKAEKDFSVYIHHHNPDQSVKRIQDKFIAYDIGKDYEGYEEYLVVMELKKGSLAATYNENGKLTRVVENYKNVRLPNNVIVSVYKSYPEWTILNDKLMSEQIDGEIIQNRYTLKIKKGKETKRLVVNPNGEILKVL